MQSNHISNIVTPLVLDFCCIYDMYVVLQSLYVCHAVLCMLCCIYNVSVVLYFYCVCCVVFNVYVVLYL